MKKKTFTNFEEIIMPVFSQFKVKVENSTTTSRAMKNLRMLEVALQKKSTREQYDTSSIEPKIKCKTQVFNNFLSPPRQKMKCFSFLTRNQK